MKFHEGDPVMHWTYGLGKIVRLEERALSGKNTLYYSVQVGELTIWVPADDNVQVRLRAPTPKARFKDLLAILSAPGEPLPEDRQERKLLLVEALKDGRAESLCRVIRDLAAHQKTKSLNENDQALMKRAQNALLGEWGFSLSIAPEQARLDLQHLLTSGSTGD